MKKTMYPPPKTSQNSHHNNQTDRSGVIGSSKLSTSQIIKQRPVNDRSKPYNYQDFGDLFGQQKTLTADFCSLDSAPYSSIQYSTFSSSCDRMIYHPGNGLHIMRVGTGKKTFISRPGQIIHTDEEIRNRVPHSNRPGRYLSNNSVKEICQAFGFAYLAARKAKRTVKFITLTLPGSQAHRDQTLKKHLINHFNTWLREEKKVQRYIWVQESQENGTAHFHYIVDNYIFHEDLRRVWNQIIEKLGYIERYRARMSVLSESQYIELRKNETNISMDQIRAAFKEGQRTNWSNPNTTDIHKVRSIHRAGRYMAKYISKINMSDATQDPDGYYSLKNRRIGGKKWARSQILKEAKRNCGQNLDNKSFEIAMEGIRRARHDERLTVVTDDYRVHIYGPDVILKQYFVNCRSIEDSLTRLLHKPQIQET